MSRHLHPFRRTAREEARIWPVAVALVAGYLLWSHLAEPAPEDTTSTWQIKESER